MRFSNIYTLTRSQAKLMQYVKNFLQTVLSSMAEPDDIRKSEMIYIKGLTL